MSDPTDIPTDVPESKKVLRLRMQALLAAVDPAERRAASREACARLLELGEVRDAAVVLIYMALPSELDPRAAAEICLEEGIRVAVPVVDPVSRELEAVEIESLNAAHFERGALGILTPKAGRRVRATEIDAAVVPGLAFDRRGQRLGRGAGYYDKLLVRLTERCHTIGFAFARQVLDRLPTEAHDRRVASLVTESEVVACDEAGHA